MSYLARRLWGLRAGIIAVGSAFLASACSSTVTTEGPGGAGGGGNSNSTGNTTQVGGNGGTSSGGTTPTASGGSSTGGSVPVDCVTAENFDPCASPGSYCSYYDASTNEYCDAYCDETYHWQKYCYVEPTYCYNPPSLCPSTLPTTGSACQTTPECEYYECEIFGACGGSGYGFATCDSGIWYTYESCHCFQPQNLCPTSPPQNGAFCTVTEQCQTYECEWYDSCGQNTYHYGFCDGFIWQTAGDCM
jgi:hypothetical protein